MKRSGTLLLNAVILLSLLVHSGAALKQHVDLRRTHGKQDASHTLRHRVSLVRTNASRVKDPEMHIDSGALKEQYDELQALGVDEREEKAYSRPFPRPNKLAADMDPLSSAPEPSPPDVSGNNDIPSIPAPLATKVPEYLRRPNEGGKPDIVEFDVVIKRLVGIDFTNEDFTVDAIVMTTWKDKRAKRIIPPGLKSISMSPSSAEKNLWLPELDITNEDFGGLDVISTEIMVKKDGTVVKVQRILARLLNLYDPSLFPFDTQVLKVELASKLYMDEALRLRPVQTPSKVAPENIDSGGFIFVSSEITSVTDNDPHSRLKKSRGVLSITVRRNSEAYWSVVLVPEMMLVAFSYTVFLLPQESAFAMPRVATTMITFMSLMALTLKTSTLLPVRGGPTWIDCFEECCTALVWASSWFNILFMIAIYDHGLKELSASLEAEVTVVFPTVALICGGLLLLAVFYFHFFIWMERVCLVFGLGGHFIASVYRVYRNCQEKKK